NVQRRVVDATGKPVARQPKTLDPDDPEGGRELPVEKDGWVTLKPGSAYRPYVFLSGLRLEEEDDKKLDAVMFDGLVMPRLLQMRGGRYPHLEMDLPKIQEALKTVKEKADPTTSGRPSNFNTDNFDPFSVRRGENLPGQGNPRDPHRPESGPGPGRDRAPRDVMPRDMGRPESDRGPGRERPGA